MMYCLPIYFNKKTQYKHPCNIKKSTSQSSKQKKKRSKHKIKLNKISYPRLRFYFLRLYQGLKQQPRESLHLMEPVNVNFNHFDGQNRCQ